MSFHPPAVIKPQRRPYRHPEQQLYFHSYVLTPQGGREYLGSQTLMIKPKGRPGTLVVDIPMNHGTSTLLIEGYDQPPPAVHNCFAVQQNPKISLGLDVFAMPTEVICLENTTPGAEGRLILLQPSVQKGRLSKDRLLRPFTPKGPAQHRILLDDSANGVYLYEAIAPQNGLTERACWPD